MAVRALENSYRRELANAKGLAGGFSDSDDGDASADDNQESVARNFRRVLNLARGNYGTSQKDISKELMDKELKIAKEKIKQIVLRKISWAFGATLVMFIVTWAIWTVQVIWGNWLQKGVPPLNRTELIIWACCTLLLIATVLIGVVLLLLALLVSVGPVVGLKIFGLELFNALADAAREYFPFIN